ncbi:MAG: radical SAM protein [Nitrospinota bacterium]|nr:radical SAM protein [Nitrospinota bacterium]MDH5757318.1 radical SAM protein [Nitrospinota bacterium]
MRWRVWRMRGVRMRIPWDFGSLPWRRRFPTYKRGLLLQWHITNRCALRCAHCYQEEFSGPELSLPDLLKVLEQYKALLRSLNNRSATNSRGHVTITGGDPFARADVWELLEVVAAHSELFGFAILTNGRSMDEASARRLARLGPRFVQVSLEGEEQTHDGIRGDGDHAHVVRALKIMIRQGLETMVSFTAHSENFRQFPAVVALGRRLGVGKVWTDRMIPCGASAGAEGPLPLDQEQTGEYIGIVDTERRRAARSFFGRTQVGADRALQFIAAGGRPYHCSAGDSLITIMPDGRLYPCRRMPTAVGNVMETPLARLYHSSGLFRRLRDKKTVSQGCQGCMYQRFCRGGLKCLSHAALGDPFQADPGCPLAHAQAQQNVNFIL